MIHFIESSYKESLFHKGFYHQLSTMFGHIAHYNKFGFYEEWFANRERQREFLKHLKGAYVCSNPKYTWSDVEKALQTYLKTHTEKGENHNLF